MLMALNTGHQSNKDAQMKCPNCDFIDKDEAFGEPAICPKCSAIYEKALRVRQLRDQVDAQKSAKIQTKPASNALKSKFENAAEAVADGRRAREATAAVKTKKREQQMVIVTDIDMPFMSMVSFMIKWMLASIPAVIILMIVLSLGAVFLAALGILVR